MDIKPTPVSRLDKWVLRMDFRFNRVPLIGDFFFVWNRHNAEKYGRLDAARNYPVPD